MKGRKPLPTNLKLLKGTARKSRLNANEPKPDPAPTKPPAWLGVESRPYWDRLAPVLVKTGVLTGADVTALGLLCDAMAQYDAAREIVRREGRVMEVDGVRKAHPLYKVMKGAWEDSLSMMREFGMTPSSRSRVSVSKADEPGNPFDQF